MKHITLRVYQINTDDLSWSTICLMTVSPRVKLKLRVQSCSRNKNYFFIFLRLNQMTRASVILL